MPKDWDPHYEDEQDWEPVVFKRNTNTATISSQKTPIHSKICLARSKAGYTSHELAQKLHMKIKEYQKIENGEMSPSTDLLTKLRKIIDLKLV
tara:strand:+ start:65 stop:343 length:279 start_codon:yes stop_codon:yes gene_type:complete